MTEPVITDFLRTSRSKAELATALDVLREFKRGESEEEWVEIPFLAWAKLEQLEEFLDHLVNGTPLKDDTVNYLAEQHLKKDIKGEPEPGP